MTGRKWFGRGVWLSLLIVLAVLWFAAPKDARASASSEGFGYLGSAGWLWYPCWDCMGGEVHGMGSYGGAWSRSFNGCSSYYYDYYFVPTTGARIVVTLLNAMQERDVKRGLATLCIGGGEALALVVER